MEPELSRIKPDSFCEALDGFHIVAVVSQAITSNWNTHMSIAVTTAAVIRTVVEHHVES